MNKLEIKLRELNPNLFGKLNETIEEVKLLLNQYIKNFPDYTDHSIHHTNKVYGIVADVLNDDEIENLNDDEIYILSMASYLHDIGMCIPEEKIKNIADTEELLKQRELNPDQSREKYLRDIHHTLSKKFILEEWELLKIPNEKYAEAIGLVSEGHRIVDIGNPELFNPKFYVKSGRSFVCLPYLASILRIADELDITNIRTPELLTKYYMPENEKSISEWKKHIATSLMFFSDNYVEFEVKCSNHNMLAALEDQFNKISESINYCQKVIRNIHNTENRKFSLKLEQVKSKITYDNFDPRGIKYSFDIVNVVDAFVGENLYENKLNSLRELIQNSIDTCRYKKSLINDYKPNIKIKLADDKIIINDNGLGMDEFIIKNYFGKLGSSYYQQEDVKKDYDAIGQFGVGVFSYFLISEYIDIETKTQSSETLHFRLDKDPKNYFHFFKESTRSEPGTTITLYLKKEFENKNPNEFLSYIEDTFRYIEFPIEIESKNGIHFIEKQKFNFDNFNEIIVESLKHSKKNNCEQIHYEELNFEENEIEGTLFYLYRKDYSFDNIFYDLNENCVFKDDTHDNSKVNISQKGVFITSKDFFHLNDVLINLNLKKKLKINISRNDITDDSYKKLVIQINKLYIKIILQLFQKINNSVPLKELPLITNNFLKNSLSYKYLYEIFDNIKEVLHLNFIDKTNEFLTFTDFEKKEIDSFILSFNSAFTEKIKKKENTIPIIEIFDTFDMEYRFTFNKYSEIFHSLNYNYKIIKIDSIYVAKFFKVKNFKKQKIKFDESTRYYFSSIELIESESPLIISDIFYFNRKLFKKKEHFSGESYNLNNKFIQQIYSTIGIENNLSQSQTSIIKDLFEEFNRVFGFNKISNKKIDNINKTYGEELKKIGINYTFSKSDFIY